MIRAIRSPPFSCAPGRIRTYDPRIRSPYESTNPAENTPNREAEALKADDENTADLDSWGKRSGTDLTPSEVEHMLAARAQLRAALGKVGRALAGELAGQS